MYHTKRMQRVFAVRFSGDASYVFSGSDDMNVRMWKVGATLQHLVLGHAEGTSAVLAQNLDQAIEAWLA